MKKIITYLNAYVFAVAAPVKKIFKKKANKQGYMVAEDILFV